MPGKNKRQLKGENRAQDGFALVIVVVIMLLISFLAVELILSVRTEMKIAMNEKSQAVGQCLAEGGINLGIFRLLDKPVEYIEDYEKFLEGYEYTAILETGQIRYCVVNESGKFDLNKLNQPLLKLLLEYYGIEEEQQDIIIDSLLDWEDSDDLHHINGAELETYQSLKDPYIPRNGKIMDPSEFFLVHGTSVLAGRFKASEIFTVHNERGLINFNSLTPRMLEFLTEGDEKKIKAYYDARGMYGDLNQVQARQILGDERFSQCSDGLTYSAGRNRYYTIYARGIPRGNAGRDLQDDEERGGSVEVYSLIVLQGTRINYLAWKEGGI